MRSSMGACYIYNEFWHILSEINVLHYDIRAISTIRVYAADAHCRCKKIVTKFEFQNLGSDTPRRILPSLHTPKLVIVYLQ